MIGHLKSIARFSAPTIAGYGRVCLLFIAVTALATISSSCSREDSAPKYEIQAEKEGGKDPSGVLTVEVAQNRSFFDVSSESGIGAATIKLVAGVWSDSLVFRLHLKGLEGFTITSGEKSLTLEDMQMKVFREDGTVFEGKYLLNEKGFYEVILPKGSFAEGSDEIEIHWVDFYR